MVFCTINLLVVMLLPKKGLLHFSKILAVYTLYRIGMLFLLTMLYIKVSLCVIFMTILPFLGKSCNTHMLHALVVYNFELRNVISECDSVFLVNIGQTAKMMDQQMLVVLEF